MKPYTGLHINGVAPLSEGKTITVGAEPEIAALIKEREENFCFLMMDVILCDFRGQTQPWSSLFSDTCAQQGQGPTLAVSPIMPYTFGSPRVASLGGSLRPLPFLPHQGLVPNLSSSLRLINVRRKTTGGAKGRTWLGWPRMELNRAVKHVQKYSGGANRWFLGADDGWREQRV